MRTSNIAEKAESTFANTLGMKPVSLVSGAVFPDYELSEWASKTKNPSLMPRFKK
jgi:hypothetical protein